MNKNGINAQIKSVDFEGGLITVSFEDGTQSQTVAYYTNPEIDEVIETTVDTPVVEWIPGENEGDPAIPATFIKSEVVRTKTGNKIPNPQYKNPQRIEDLEEICIENGFTK